MTTLDSNTPHRHQRRTPPAARGETATWLTGGALVTSLMLIVSIVALIVYHGGKTFWPGPVQLITTVDGESFLGVPLDVESVAAEEGDGLRQRFRVGNRDLGQESFEWVDRADITNTESPESAWFVEREDWGVFMGFPEAILETPIDPTEDAQPLLLASGVEEVEAEFARLHRDAERRRSEIHRLNDVEAPRLQDKLNQIKWSRRKIELQRARTSEAGLSMPLWIGSLLGLGLSIGLTAWFFRAVQRTTRGTRQRKQVRFASVLALGLTIAMGLAVLLEHPWASRPMSETRATASLAKLDENQANLTRSLDQTLEELRTLRLEDERTRIVIRDPRTDRFAPESRSTPDTPLRLSQVIRVVPSNQLSLLDRIGVYLARWGEFLTVEPRSDGAEGGVFPIIVGTVILTLLLNICVVPLGVIAALYLREYARQGTFTSIIRIAINNLAGVPSIVYGMFGLGFFCYFLGGYIDGGASTPIPRGSWWVGVGFTFVFVLLGAAATMFAAATPGKQLTAFQRSMRAACWILWTLAILSAGRLIFTSPYFEGFFAHKLPESSTMGSRGILWAALTLALLTLPVVIVATEEAIAAVPNSMREGSLACGASKWQTIRRIVLPSSLPGVMTGAILAMARGAGEVAPLMLVGAVNFAPGLPVSGEAPFLHGDRTFMHLGFHIYSLGFQSPDVEAAKPLVWTTTLLLILIVLFLNLIAVFIRGRLRNQMTAASI